MLTKIKPFIISLLFSIPIYTQYFNISSFLLNSIVGILVIYLLFKLDKKNMFINGFLTGIFIFYWISISFIYYGFWYLIPLGIIGIGIIYGLLFYFIAYFKNYYYRLLAILSISYIHPLGFNWFDLNLLFINSYISNTTILIIIVFLFVILKQNFKFIPFIILPFIIHIPNIKNNNLNIKLITTNISQDIKWQKGRAKDSFYDVKKEIEIAIKEKKDIIVFPESSIETYLNHQPFMIKYLKNKSYDISIVVGSLTLVNKKLYNSNYIFTKGNMTIAHKVVLVPIGEKIPLPKFLTDIINNIFYNGASDYNVANNVTNYKINNITFRNAICFEATTNTIYKNNPKYIIANSNNAWFRPSIQPTIQKMLLQILSNRYNTTIFHSINGSNSYIISPQ
jgi:apolipoprotein N-acyltransferase